MVLLIKPVGDGLGSRAEENIKKAAIFSEIPAKLFGNGKNDMTMAAVKELGRNDFSSLRLISSPAGIAETGMASERNDPVSSTVGTAIHGKAAGRIAAGDDLLDFRKDNRTNFVPGMGFDECIPVILENLSNSDFRFHMYILKENER